MKIIKLAHGKGVVKVDDEDFERLSDLPWHRSGRYAHNFSFGQMHRFILGITDREVLVDHKDRDGLNNQKANLRPCTREQNAANKRKPIRTYTGSAPTSKYKGVSAVVREGKLQWAANMCGIKIGVFLTEKAAALAYDKALIAHYGEFAGTNF